MLFLLLAASVAAAPNFYKFSPLQEQAVQPEQLIDTYGQCIDVTFQQAQIGFNNLLGIDPSVTWRQGVSLNGRVDQLLLGNQSGIELVCNARQIFSQTLGAMYPYCINRYTLLNKGNTDFTNCLYYVHLYKHLEFMCSTGWDVFYYNWDCIRGVEKAPAQGNTPNAYNQCFNAFGNNVNSDPNNFCQYTNTFTKCIQTLFTNTCGAPTGWAQCEMERIGFASDCPNLVCTP